MDHSMNGSIRCRTGGKVIAVVAVVAALGVTSCGSDVESVTARSAAADRSGATGEAVRSNRDVLEVVSLSDADLPEGWLFEMYTDGDVVDGQVTMDICGAEFSSESARTARLQRGATDPTGTDYLSNESVVYRSAVDAETALAELRRAVLACPPGEFVGSTVAGVPPLRYELELGDLEGVTADHVVVRGTVVDRDGERYPYAGVWQRRGRVMTAVYGDTLEGISRYAAVSAVNLGSLTPAESGD
jgi:hypothetical protein